MDKTYNGWANRETWLVNLHFGTSLQETLQEAVNNEHIDNDTNYNEIAEILENFVDEAIEDELNELNNLSSFLSDLINLSQVDYRELADIYESGLVWLEEE